MQIQKTFSLVVHRLRKFCGFRADSVLSETNIVKIRFFTTATAINSSFSIVFTAFREKEGKGMRRSFTFDKVHSIIHFHC